MKSEELARLPMKDCPFCGAASDGIMSPTEEGRTVIGYWCECGSCGGRTAILPTVQIAVAAWNRRASIAAKEG